jgi:uncharacterized protein with gpF-like domain
VSLDPRTAAFWQNETALMWEEFNPLVMRALLAGASSGAAALPLELQPLIDWSVFNQSALRYLQDFRLATIPGITATTQQQVIQAIDDWVREGSHLDNLTNRLKIIFPPTRAEAIAVTEVTRIFAEGNVRLWGSTGVVQGKRWMTAVDERVCPFCAPLHGQIVELGGEFGLTPEQMAESGAMKAMLGRNYDQAKAIERANTMLRNVGTSAKNPPYHVRCRCWLQPVVSSELLREQIGGLLAGQFFAKVHDEVYVV